MVGEGKRKRNITDVAKARNKKGLAETLNYTNFSDLISTQKVKFDRRERARRSATGQKKISLNGSASVLSESSQQMSSTSFNLGVFCEYPKLECISKCAQCV